MSRPQATEVFTPGSFPTHTYVVRGNERFEQQLRNAIAITGAGIIDAAQIWDRVLDWIEEPHETTTTRTISGGATIGGTAKGEAGIVVAKAEVSGTGTLTATGQQAHAGRQIRRGITQVVDEIGGSSFVVLLDDFHYMSRDVQTEAAKQIKDAARRGVKIITASVPHRADDVVRANPELRGRVTAIDLGYWSRPELEQIPQLGFEKLNVTIDRETIAVFASECAGSPQLMQTICLQTCFELHLRSRMDSPLAKIPSADERREIFVRSATTTDMRSLVDVLESGPKTRGTERSIFKFVGGGEGDVYRCVLRAVAKDPPILTFPYAEITRRAREVCAGAEPVGSSIVGALSHMQLLAKDKFPGEKVVDWDEQKQVLDVPDPYLIFYLRWSGRLQQT